MYLKILLGLCAGQPKRLRGYFSCLPLGQRVDFISTINGNRLLALKIAKIIAEICNK